MTQAETDPFPYSDTNKRYHTYDYYLRRTFGGKCAKIPLDAGMTCPNIDGTCGHGGCIYCSSRGSGDFAPPPAQTLREQYDAGRASLSEKWPTERCIAYLQAHTNTYAPTEYLRRLYEEILTYPGLVGLNIATRADCLPDGTVALLRDISDRTVLTVELGLQTAHDRTAALIHRGHTLADFLDGYRRLRDGAPRARVCVHLILGLPGESVEDMLTTVRTVAALRPDEVKLHLLYVLRGTVLGEWYESGKYVPMTQADYTAAVVAALEYLPPETVVSRVTGDGAGEELLAPRWSRGKRAVLAEIDRRLYGANTWQGKKYQQDVDTETNS